MSTFPSILTSYTDPTPTSPLNAPSHSGIETAQNSGLKQLEATVGLAGASSTLGTIIGDLRSPGSNGGGHVQSANTGGTGQTSYNKGDMLVATSSSVMGKIAVGSDLQVLQADSTQTSGVKWAAIVANKVAVSTSSLVASQNNSSSPIVIYAASILANTLSTNNAVRFTGAINRIDMNDNVKIIVNYGNNVTASVLVASTNSSIMAGMLTGIIAANGSASSQTSWVMMDAQNNTGVNSLFHPNATGFGAGNSSVASTSDQNLVITASGSGGGNSSIVAGIFIVEKIQ